MKKPLLIPMLTILFSMIFLSCEKDDDDNPSSTSPKSIRTEQDLNEALNKIHANSDAPGLAVTVVKNGAIIYQEAFGEANIANGYAYTNQTTQPIGSISKVFVAAAIVKAIEDGYFSLETDINDILPVELVNPKKPDGVIKVKHLVTHTSGLLDQPEAYFQAYHILPGENLSTLGGQLLHNEFGFQQRAGIPLGDFLSEYYLPDGDLYQMDNFSPVEPGSAWNYSNLATSLSAYLIEVATGVPFDEYVSQHVLLPLGMMNTSYQSSNLNASTMATLYWDKSTPLPLYANDSYPDGSLNTSNEDLSKFLIDMMNGAKGQSATLFSKDGYKMLFEAQLPDGTVPRAFADNQGIFWFHKGDNIKHDGSDPGTTCNLQFSKNGESGFLLLTNMDASSTGNEIGYMLMANQVESAIQEYIANN